MFEEQHGANKGVSLLPFGAGWKLEGLFPGTWIETRLTASCPHRRPLVNCMCGIYGVYSAALTEGPDTDGLVVLASCLFYGRTVIATKGVRAIKAEIESMWLIREALCAAFGGILNEATADQVCRDVAYHLSTQYGLPVTITSVEAVNDLPAFAPPNDIPDAHIIGHYGALGDGQADAEWGTFKLELKPDSRLDRTLVNAMQKEGGILRAAVIKGLHCKNWQDCIHGSSGYATFIEKSVDAWGLLERVKRGSYRITELGRRLVKEGKAEVNASYSDYLARKWNRDTFIPFRSHQ